jgi:hypothetical protein
MTNNTKSVSSKLNSILSGLGTLTRSCNDVRHCSRCGKELQDPASWERGIGPICAKKDTHLFAKTIPANFAMATFHTLNVRDTMLPEALRPVWNALTGVLLEKTERALQGTAPTQFLITGEDCRIVSKVIDFMLSFSIAAAPKRDLIEVVRYLGFVGLAGVLSGKSSTGESELKFDNGVLTLKGSANKAGFLAMRRIPGIKVPMRRGSGHYEVDANQHVPFIAAVMEFWPCFDGEVSKITEQCEAWIAANHTTDTVATAPVSTLPKATLTNRTVAGDFTVRFTWDVNSSPALVAAIKGLAAKDRKYDPATKTWTIKSTHITQIDNLLKQNYEVEYLTNNDQFLARPIARFGRRSVAFPR